MIDSFSFRSFYERRARRILPPLIFVMLFSIPFVWIYLLPISLIDYSKSILFSMGFSSNLYFWYTGLDYGAEHSFLKLFLHTWSLSVEEQYYILFPIFLFLIYKFLKHRIILLLIILFLIDILLVQFSGNLKVAYPFVEDFENMNFEAPTIFSNFYFLTSRIWELTAGAILAYFEIVNRHLKKNENAFSNQFLSTIGVILILYSIFFYDDQMFHPSFYTLPPVVGTCLIIWFSRENGFINNILSSKLFVGIGLISYSLYLWHYPIFAIDRITELTSENLMKKLVLIIVIISLSLFSYFFIEKPARNKKNTFKKILIYLCLSSLLLIVINLVIITKDGFRSRFNNINNFFPNFEIDGLYLVKKRDQFYDKIDNIKKFTTNKTNVLIVGDSHGKDLYLALYQNINNFKEFDFAYFSTEGNFNINHIEKLINDKLISDAEIVIFSVYWERQFRNNHNEIDKIFKKISELKKQGKKIIITSNTNVYKSYSYKTPIDKIVLKEKSELNLLDINSYKNYYFNNREINALSDINLYIKKLSNFFKFIYLNKEEYLCNLQRKECDYITPDGYKIFYDYGHYTLEGSKYLGQKIYKDDWLFNKDGSFN